MNINKLKDEIFIVKKSNFNALALEIFRYQYQHLPVYRNFVDLIKINPDTVQRIEDIPFLPITLFKTQAVIQADKDHYPIVFESSSTTSQVPSKHYVQDPDIYIESFMKGFEQIYGSIKNYCVLGLLPSYLERSASSLVYMVDHWIQACEHPDAGFYLYNHEELYNKLGTLWDDKKAVLLIGVSFALLDFAGYCEQHPISFPTEKIIVIETGGMKGRKEEMQRDELHHILKQKLNLKVIHSEYGMTELLSQAYSKQDGLFVSPNWMKTLIRDINDPLQVNQEGKGVLNIIDLANIHSCSFIATDDLVEIYSDGSFRVLGRLDQSELRGCSLMVL